MIVLPKNPKVDDLLPIITALDARVVELEAYVSRNDVRITALERRYEASVADADKLRWALQARRRT